MQRLIKTAILTAVVLTVAASLATTADEPRHRDALPRQVAAKSAVFQQYLRLQRQAVEAAADPLLAGAIGIHKIKEIAVKSGKLEAGADALRMVAAETGRPALRRLALLALGELQMAAGKPVEAIGSLAELCLEREEEEDGEPGRGIRRRGPCGGGQCGPCPGKGEQRQCRQRHEREEREEMEQSRLRREHGPREMDPRGPDVRRMLERRSRQLDEKARRIEQRMEELKRWAHELEKREREKRDRE